MAKKKQDDKMELASVIDLSDVGTFGEPAKQSKSKKKEASPMIKSYVCEMDTHATLKSIVQDMKDCVNLESYNKWDIPALSLKGMNMHLLGPDRVQLVVTEIVGGFRIPDEDPQTLVKRSKETFELLKKFESAVKKEFKERTGKALSLTECSRKNDFQKIAFNGVYRFLSTKVFEFKTTVKPQEANEVFLDD